MQISGLISQVSSCSEHGSSQQIKERGISNSRKCDIYVTHPPRGPIKKRLQEPEAGRDQSESLSGNNRITVSTNSQHRRQPVRDHKNQTSQQPGERGSGAPRALVEKQLTADGFWDKDCWKDADLWAVSPARAAHGTGKGEGCLEASVTTIKMYYYMHGGKFQGVNKNIIFKLCAHERQ